MWQRKIYLDNEPVEKAWEKCQGFFSSRGLIRPLDTERIPVAKALGRVTASPVLALISSPHYAAAAMDGIAVLAKNTFGATETAPLKLQLGTEAVEVDTGDPIPEGFDAVIMAEEINYSRDGMIEITAAAAPWQHVRAIGEDLVATEMIVPANHLLRPYDIGGILAGGVVEVEVWRRPRVAIIPTGTELVEPGTPLKPGDIMEFNSKMLGAFVEEWGGEPVICPIVPDDYETIKGAVREAAQKAEVIVINAGSSAGREDYTASIISELGELCLHGVAMKPGKPVMVGSACGKPVVGIPGYPVSAALTFETFVKPIIFSKLGQPLPEKPVLEGFLARKLPSPLGTEEFVRVTLGQVGGKVMVIPIARGAGVISSLIRADGILRIPASSEGLEAGGRVKVELLSSPDQIEKTLVVAGSHDLTIDLMANALRQAYGLRISSSNVGSLGGILALKRGEAHLAGMHLLDEETGDYNVSYIQRYLPEQEVVLVNLAFREQGLMVAPGNPKRIRGFKDLIRSDVRFVNRQPGAGTRILLDYYLTKMEMDPVLINGYQRGEFTHLAVAAAVKSGSCDVGLGVLAAARALGLDFIPLARERYDLCIPLEYWEWSHWKKLLSILRSQDFQEKVKRLGGYDVSGCGQIVWSTTPVEREA